MVHRKRSWWAWLKREPLILFVLIGALLFGVDRLRDASHPADGDPQLISVERAALLRFLQYRNKVFDERGASRTFDLMSRAERKDLIDEYIREEALYREAMSWGFDKQDYVIRRRLVQTVEFTLQDGQQVPAPVSESALQQFYSANRQFYATAPTVSFSHAFFKGSDAGSRARLALQAVRSGKIDPTSAGDRFLYDAGYARQPLDSVARDFGEKFKDTLWANRQKDGWFGPILSAHGLHIVRITAFDSGGLAPFDAVRAKVVADLADNMSRARKEAALRQVVEQYRVSLAPDLR